MGKKQAIFGLMLSIDLLTLSVGVGGQQNPIGGTGTSSSPARAPFSPHDASDAADAFSHPLVTQQQLEKSRQNERQRRMTADTNRLLALASELKADSDKTKQDTTTTADIRKIEEIEKLAHNVKERMKN